MKKIIYSGIAATFLLFNLGFKPTQSMDNCDKKTLTESCKKKLEKYRYDSQKFSKINFLERAQLLEIEVPIFIGEKYRLVFNTTSLPKDIVISVYTKDRDAKKREAVFTTAGSPADLHEFVFDAPRMKNMFIDYNVPITEINPKLSGCVVFMIGYKAKSNEK